MQTGSVKPSHGHDPLYYSMSKSRDMSEKYLTVLQNIMSSFA